MKKPIIILTILFLFLQACNTCNNKLSDNAKLKVKKHFKIELLVNNKDAKSIGYKVYANDEDIGVKGIFVDKGFFYITDVYHVNIKKINIKTKEIKCSESLSDSPPDKSGIWLRDIAIFNNRIYVTSDRDSIYTFNMELKYLSAIPTKIERKHFNKITKDSLLVNNSLLIKKDGSLKKTNININNNKQTVQGKYYKTYSKNGKHYFESKYGTIELEKPIPELKEYSGAENFNFDSSTLVYFDSTPTKLIFYIYKW